MKDFVFIFALNFNLINHIFGFENKLYRQTKGGTISVRIAGDVANLFMAWLDRQLKKKLQDKWIEVRMYSRYVDDTNIRCEEMDINVEAAGLIYMFWV